MTPQKKDEDFFREYPGVIACLRSAMPDEIAPGAPRLGVLIVRFAGELHARFMPWAWTDDLSARLETRFPVPANEVEALLGAIADGWREIENWSLRRETAQTC
jgi:hypothetical protein